MNMDFLYKNCKKCGLEKVLNEFYTDKRTKDGYESGCKECKKKYNAENKERISQNKKEYYEKNKESLLEYKKNYKQQNPDKIRLSNKRWREINKDLIMNYYKNMSEEEKIERNKSTKKWRQENKESVNFQRNEYKKRRLKNDILFALKHNITSSLLFSLRRKGFTKRSRTNEILGCSFEEFKNYIESKFENWMNWENRGLYNGELNYGWDIDHIVPLSIAESEDDIIRLNHYTNLRPLCSKINRDIKRDKIEEDVLQHSLYS